MNAAGSTGVSTILLPGRQSQGNRENQAPLPIFLTVVPGIVALMLIEAASLAVVALERWFSIVILIALFKSTRMQKMVRSPAFNKRLLHLSRERPGLQQ